MSSYPLLNVFLTMMWFFLWVLWLYMVFWVIFDIFRSPDLNGWVKAGWVLLTILLPFIGVLIYLIARGSMMHERRGRNGRNDTRRPSDRALPDDGQASVVHVDPIEQRLQVYPFQELIDVDLIEHRVHVYPLGDGVDVQRLQEKFGDTLIPAVFSAHGRDIARVGH